MTRSKSEKEKGKLDKNKKKAVEKIKFKELKVRLSREVVERFMQANQPNLRIDFEMAHHVKKVDDLSLEGNISENWRRFKRDFSIFLIASRHDGDPDNVKIATFLNAIGKEAREVYESFGMTAEQRVVYNQVIAAFDAFCEPKKNIIYELFLFYRRDQKQKEPFDSFLMDLRRLARTCNFGQAENEMIRDRIVIGTANKRLQTKLLDTPQLTYESAIQKARAIEATEEQTTNLNDAKNVDVVTRGMQSNNNNTRKKNHVDGKKSNDKKWGNKGTANNNNNNTNIINSNNKRNNTSNSNFNSNSNNKCKYCNFVHKPKECPAYNRTCNYCSRKNHFMSVCQFRDKSVKLISRENENYDEENAMYIRAIEQVIDTVSDNGVPAWFEEMQINHFDVNFKIDTGSDVNVVSEKLLNRIIPNLVIGQPSHMLSPSMIKGWWNNDQDIGQVSSKMRSL